MEEFDPYAELQLSPDAEPELVKAAFKALAKKYHPDRFTDPREKARAEERMARINEAQRLLASGQYRPPSPPPPHHGRKPPGAPPSPHIEREPPSTDAPPSPPPPLKREGQKASTTSPKKPVENSIRKGPFVAAALLFVALLTLPGIFSEGHFEKAVALEGSGKYQESLEQVNRAIEKAPHNRELYRFRAQLWDKLGEPEKAAVDRQNGQEPTQLRLPAHIRTESPSSTPTP